MPKPKGFLFFQKCQPTHLYHWQSRARVSVALGGSCKTLSSFRTELALDMNHISYCLSFLMRGSSLPPLPSFLGNRGGGVRFNFSRKLKKTQRSPVSVSHELLWVSREGQCRQRHSDHLQWFLSNYSKYLAIVPNCLLQWVWALFFFFFFWQKPGFWWVVLFSFLSALVHCLISPWLFHWKTEGGGTVFLKTPPYLI